MIRRIGDLTKENLLEIWISAILLQINSKKHLKTMFFVVVVAAIYHMFMWETKWL